MDPGLKRCTSYNNNRYTDEVLSVERVYMNRYGA